MLKICVIQRTSIEPNFILIVFTIQKKNKTKFNFNSINKKKKKKKSISVASIMWQCLLYADFKF